MQNKNQSISNFFKQESAGGIVLMIATLFAIIVANSPLQSIYNQFIETPVEIKIGLLKIAKPLLLWINDGLMAFFFFLVGLELKRELVEGELSNKKNILLPIVGAIGGMLIPALIYVYFNWGDKMALQGWAIPAATDIAFALGILSLIGPHVPASLKVFLTSLAIFDDIGAIIIIALLYTAHISYIALFIVFFCIVCLFILNKVGVEHKSIYIFIGIIMWVAMLKSGVHATLTGVILAMFIPLKSKRNPESFPAKEMEHDLHFPVAFIVLPLFAFANSGINIHGIGADQLFHKIPIGIALGLFLGKQIGIFTLCWIIIKTGLTTLPTGMNWKSLYGVALLCGIGFTMSLFIGSLAFEETGVNMIFDERLGIIVGSTLSGIAGYLILRYQYKN